VIRTSDLLHIGFRVLPVLLFPSLLFEKLEQFLAVEGTSWCLVHLVAASVCRGDVGVLETDTQHVTANVTHYSGSNNWECFTKLTKTKIHSHIEFITNNENCSPTHNFTTN